MTERTLRSLKVLITRPEEGAEEFKRKLEFKGAEAIVFPLIKLKLKEDLSKLEKAFDELADYDWVVFNSPAAVRFFFQLIEERGMKLYFYPELKFATVGEKTKMTLEQLGYRTNFVPIKYTAEVLAENMPEIEGKKILIPASEKTTGNYFEVFQKRGAIPNLIKIYENQDVEYDTEAKRKIEELNVNYITFTSASAVHSFVQNFGPNTLPKAKVVCIGPSTASAARENNMEVSAIANPHTVEGIIDQIVELEKQIENV